MQRRTLLGLGVASGAALALVGGGAALFYERAWRDGHLAPTGRHVVRAVARGVLDGSLPAVGAAKHAALEAHLDRMEVTLRALPQWTQRELADLLAVLALPPGRLALSGLTPDWASASVAEIQAALQTMRTSRMGLRQKAYHALRDLTHAAYFADRSTWPLLGYPGPTQFA
jgi:uncharacterized protein YjiS (DUF1127 family)